MLGWLFKDILTSFPFPSAKTTAGFVCLFSLCERKVTSNFPYREQVLPSRLFCPSRFLSCEEQDCVLDYANAHLVSVGWEAKDANYNKKADFLGGRAKILKSKGVCSSKLCKMQLKISLFKGKFLKHMQLFIICFFYMLYIYMHLYEKFLPTNLFIPFFHDLLKVTYVYSH